MNQEPKPTTQIFKAQGRPGDNLTLTADAPHRYSLRFEATGTTVEFVMLAGQTFTVKGITSDLTLTMNDIEPALPGGGLQLVPTLQQQEKSND